jgi:predicted phage terminase large subunit-like protein
MEITEPETARILARSGTREALIESNNGGRGFARNIIDHLKKLNAKKCTVTWFHQSKNKKTRILVNATNVMEQIIMPDGWKKKYPEFFKAIQTYQRKGKNAHDDAADALTGFAELINGEVKGRNKAKIRSKTIFGGRL